MNKRIRKSQVQNQLNELENMIVIEPTGYLIKRWHYDGSKHRHCWGVHTTRGFLIFGDTLQDASDHLAIRKDDYIDTYLKVTQDLADFVEKHNPYC